MVVIVKAVERVDSAADIDIVICGKAKVLWDIQDNLAVPLDRDHAALVFCIQFGPLRMATGNLRLQLLHDRQRIRWSDDFTTRAIQAC